MIHDLVSLEYYQNIDKDFEMLALDGQKMCQKLYESCTNFRKLYFDKNYEFKFPEEVMEGCPCAKIKNNNTEG